MKSITKDEKGYLLNTDFSNFYLSKEYYIDIPEYISFLFDFDTERYLVSNWGHVYDKYNNHYLPQNLIPDNNRYIILMLKKKDNTSISVKAHSLICSAFNGILALQPIDQILVVNHIDGVKWHNEPYNLEWLTWSENVRHADRTGLINRPNGENNGYSMLTDDQYREICRLTQEGYYPNQINKIMNIGYDITNIAQKIRSKKSGSMISQNYDFSNIPRHNYSKFNDNDVIKICELIKNNFSDRDILKAFNIDIDLLNRYDRYLWLLKIRNIRNGKSFVNITSKYLF